MDLTAQWIAGFVDGEGCFHVGVSKNSTMKLGVQVLPEFTVTQSTRDDAVLYALKSFFGCGVVRSNTRSCNCYRVRSRKHFKTIIIPFFEKHKLKTKKRVDFLKFRAVVALMDDGAHLTQEGLKKIQALKGTMNS